MENNLLSQWHFWISVLPTLSGTIKVCLFLLIWLILWFPLAYPTAQRIGWKPFEPVSATPKLLLVASLYITVPFLVWLTILVEETSLSDYGLLWQSEFVMSLLWGLGLGITGLGLVFGLEGVCGWLVWHKGNFRRLGTLALPLLGLGLWVGITEELIFRGILLNLLQNDYSLVVAAIISSGIFAILHLLWERQETLPQLPGLWLMGMVLVWARVIDNGSLGLASGLHAGWVWGLAALDAAELISYTDNGLTWVIGWKKQPLAGISGILCLLATGGILWPIFH